MGDTVPDEAASRRTQVWIALISGLAGIVVAGIGLIGTLAATDSTISPAGPAPNSSAATPVPEVTVTRTVPGPTVTVTETVDSGGGAPAPSNAIHLADSSSIPDGILVDNEMSAESDLKIDGRTFDYGWTDSMSRYVNPHVVVGVNANQGYSKFKARIGLASTSGNNSGKLEIRLDGKVKTYKVDLTTSYDIDLTITGVQRVEIKVLTPTNDVLYALGDPVLVP